MKKKEAQVKTEIITQQNSTSAKKQNSPTVCNIETKHQQILRRKTVRLINSAETTAEAAKIPRQMSLLIK